MMKENDLAVNNSEAEEFRISRDKDDNWMKCTILCNLLDTESDINRRHGLASKANLSVSPLNSESSVHMVRSIFLYNSELWWKSGKFVTRCIVHKGSFLEEFSRSVIRKRSPTQRYIRRHNKNYGVAKLIVDQ